MRGRPSSSPHLSTSVSLHNTSYTYSLRRAAETGGALVATSKRSSTVIPSESHCHPAGAKRVSGSTFTTPIAGHEHGTIDPDTRSLRSLLRDDTARAKKSAKSPKTLRASKTAFVPRRTFASLTPSQPP